MNQLLIGIAKRLVNKAIEVNSEDYIIQVVFTYIGVTNTISVTIFDKNNDNRSYYFYDDNKHNEAHISQFRYILRKIRKREI